MLPTPPPIYPFLADNVFRIPPFFPLQVLCIATPPNLSYLYASILTFLTSSHLLPICPLLQSPPTQAAKHLVPCLFHAYTYPALSICQATTCAVPGTRNGNNSSLSLKIQSPAFCALPTKIPNHFVFKGASMCVRTPHLHQFTLNQLFRHRHTPAAECLYRVTATINSRLTPRPQPSRIYLWRVNLQIFCLSPTKRAKISLQILNPINPSSFRRLLQIHPASHH